MIKYIQEQIKIDLKGIQYITKESSSSRKISVQDNYQPIIHKNEVELEITRSVSVDLQKSYEIEIKAAVTYFAKDDEDLTKVFTNEFIHEHINELVSVVMTYISALITQITGSFNGFPVVTPAVIVEAK